MIKKAIGMVILAVITAFACVGCAGAPSPVDGSKPEVDTSSAAPLEPSNEGNKENDSPENPVDPIPAEPRPLTYQMAQIGTDSGVSDNKYGFSLLLRSYSSEDLTGVTYHALSFVVQIPGAVDLMPSYIHVANRSTGKRLEETDTAMLHVYESKVPTQEYLANHTYTPNNFLMPEECNNIYTLMLITTEDLTFDDLLVTCTYLDGQEEKTEQLEFNSTMDQIEPATNYTCQNSLLQLGEEYYVLDSGRSGYGGKVDQSEKYAIKHFVCVSSPFTFSLPALDVGAVKLCSKEDLSPKTLPSGCEIYYQEEKESTSDLAISVGLKAQNGGDFETSSEFVYDSYMGLPTNHGLCVITGY